MYRVLRPGGCIGITSWKVFWRCQHPEDAASLSLGEPITLFPASSWRDPKYIENKLSAAGFVDIVVKPFEFCVTYDNEQIARTLSFLLRNAIKRVWNSNGDNDEYRDEFNSIIDTIVEEYKGKSYDNNLAAWITTAKKPNRRASDVSSPTVSHSSSSSNRSWSQI